MTTLERDRELDMLRRATATAAAKQSFLPPQNEGSCRQVGTPVQPSGRSAVGQMQARLRREADSVQTPWSEMHLVRGSALKPPGEAVLVRHGLLHSMRWALRVSWWV